MKSSKIILSIISIVSIVFIFSTLKFNSAPLLEDGIDLPTNTYLGYATFQCIKQKGYYYGIIPSTYSNGTFDLNSRANIMGLNVANMRMDLKMVACRGKSASAHIKQILVPIQIYNFNWTTLWIQVKKNTNFGCQWQKFEQKEHCAYLFELALAVETNKKKPGFFTDKQSWTQIMGDEGACPELAKYPLWYSSEDDSDQMDDFQEFGGWKLPTAKQYTQGEDICGAKINQDIVVI